MNTITEKIKSKRRGHTVIPSANWPGMRVGLSVKRMWAEGKSSKAIRKDIRGIRNYASTFHKHRKVLAHPNEGVNSLREIRVLWGHKRNLTTKHFTGVTNKPLSIIPNPFDTFFLTDEERPNLKINIKTKNETENLQKMKGST